MESFNPHGTTILAVRRNGAVSIGGDGQVTLGNTVAKQDAVKIRRIGEGKVLVTGSIAGWMPGSFQAVYNGTKAFVDNFTAGIRNELKDHEGITLTTLEPELRGDLKKRGMLTRDDRRKERKKAGLKKARKRPQFSKR